MAGRHKRELEERSCSSVKHLNVYCVDLLQLLRQNGVVIGIQHLRKGEDEVATQSAGDIGWLERGERPPELVDTRLFRWIREPDDNLGGFRTLSNARFAQRSSLGRGSGGLRDRGSHCGSGRGRSGSLGVRLLRCGRGSAGRWGSRRTGRRPCGRARGPWRRRRWLSK